MGVVTPDGCPVEAYAALPPEPELSVVRTHAATRRRVLDLGAGAGRIASALAADGHDVVAVDESAEMLRHVTGARTICARIDDLALDEMFDLVLLLSHLINVTDEAQRHGVLDAAARRLDHDGIVLIQRHDPARRPTAGSMQAGPVLVELLDVDTRQWPLVQATTRYTLEERSWDQPWRATVLDDDATRSLLARSGLQATHIDATWVVAATAR